MEETYKCAKCGDDYPPQDLQLVSVYGISQPLCPVCRGEKDPPIKPPADAHKLGMVYAG